ncbi:MAG: IS3 family transposase [Dethiobacter sp.]|nr:IS3 family transposase [Dethiobacter sp.]
MTIPGKFNTYEELEAAVIEYIEYYNNHRYQKQLNCMTPLEYRQYLLSSAA